MAWSTKVLRRVRTPTLDQNHWAPMFSRSWTAGVCKDAISGQQEARRLSSVEQLCARKKTFRLTHLAEIHADEPPAHAILFAADDLRLTLDDSMNCSEQLTCQCVTLHQNYAKRSR